MKVVGSLGMAILGIFVRFQGSANSNTYDHQPVQASPSKGTNFSSFSGTTPDSRCSMYGMLPTFTPENYPNVGGK